LLLLLLLLLSLQHLTQATQIVLHWNQQFLLLLVHARRLDTSY